MKLTVLSPADLHWRMGQQDTIPEYKFGCGSYKRSMKVDPYPAYPHDPVRVATVLELCEQAFPIIHAKTEFVLIGHEFLDRFNGITYEDWISKRDDGTKWEEKVAWHDGEVESDASGQALTTVLCAKRIPIMPSMTRYLVSHEFGHMVFDHAARRLGYRERDREELQTEYMKIRGVVESQYTMEYCGGDWHRSPLEIVANDFRLLFTGQEAEFWPHDIAPPAWDSPIGDWWRKAKEACL